MTLEEALEGMNSAREMLLKREALASPVIISEQTYRLGQYTAEVERFLGEAEEEYERKWANRYNYHISNMEPNDMVRVSKALGLNPGEIDTEPKKKRAMSATAAKQQADVDTAEDKGNIKHLTRLVGSSWKIHTGNMARWNHLQAEMKGTT